MGQIQISLNHSEPNDKSRDEKSHEEALRAIRILLRHDINYGINTLIAKDNLSEIDKIIKFAVDHAAGTINFIRPKPSKSSNWYENARLAEDDFMEIREVLEKAQYPIRVTVDCAFSFLMNNETPEALTEHGVYGCSGAKRFLSIHPDGSAYPCSFISGYSGGNVKDGLRKIWQSFKDFRAIDDELKDSCPFVQKSLYGLQGNNTS